MMRAGGQICPISAFWVYEEYIIINQTGASEKKIRSTA